MKKGLWLKVSLIFCLVASVLTINTLAASENWNQIIANAKKEGVVVTYGTSGRLSRVGDVMKAKYGVEVKHAKMSDMELTERIVREKEAGINTVDFIMAEDILGVAKQLLPLRYVENFVPDIAKW